MKIFLAQKKTSPTALLLLLGVGLIAIVAVAIALGAATTGALGARSYNPALSCSDNCTSAYRYCLAGAVDSHGDCETTKAAAGVCNDIKDKATARCDEVQQRCTAGCAQRSSSR